MFNVESLKSKNITNYALRIRLLTFQTSQVIMTIVAPLEETITILRSNRDQYPSDNQLQIQNHQED